jgi:hypothetical protein
MTHGPHSLSTKQTNDMKAKKKKIKKIYNTRTTNPTIAPTAANANNPDADLTTAGAAAEDAEEPFVEVAVALEVREADEPVVDAEEVVAVCQ